MGKVKYLTRSIENTNRKKDNISKKLPESFHVQGIAVLSYESVKKLIVRTRTGFECMRLDKIICCDASASYTVVHLEDCTSHIFSHNLHAFQQILVPHRFFRIHKSHLINLARVAGFNYEDGGIVAMDNGITIAVSMRKRDEFLRLLF